MTPRSGRHTAVFVNPDGGYGWLVVAASFLIGFANEGIILSFSVYADAYQRDLKVSATLVALIGSTQLAMYFLSGAGATALLDAIGFRLAAIVGIAISSLSYLGAAYANVYWLSLLLYGVCAGFGGGLTYLPMQIIVSHYFERYRALAIGIMQCGCSAGVAVVSATFTDMVQMHGRAYTMRIQAAVSACTILCALVYRRPPVRLLEATAKGAGETSSIGPPLSPHMRSEISLRNGAVGGHSGGHPRPMDRKDVFFSGSLEVMSAAQQTRTIDVTPVRLSLVEHPTGGCCWTCGACLHVVAKFFDLDILYRSRTLVVMTLAMAVFSLGQYTPYMFIVATSIKHGVPQSQAKWLLPAISMGSTFGRLGCACVSMRNGQQPDKLTGWTLLMAGTISACFSATDEPTLAMHIAYAILFGVFTSCTPVMRSNLIVKYWGIERLTTIFSMTRMFMGAGFLLGTPLANTIAEEFGDYPMAFAYSAICHLMAGLLMLCLHGIWQREMLRKTGRPVRAQR